MRLSEKTLAITRIFLGLIFLWAFFDKLFGLGFATKPENSWIVGGSPTSGFLEFGTLGPFAGIFQSLAGSVLVDWIFMIGLLGIGIGLTLGIAMKLSSYSGALMLILMWLAVLPPEHHPIIDDHIIYALILIFLKDTKTKLSLDKWWQKRSYVKKYNILK